MLLLVLGLLLGRMGFAGVLARMGIVGVMAVRVFAFSSGLRSLADFLFQLL